MATSGRDAEATVLPDSFSWLLKAYGFNFGATAGGLVGEEQQSYNVFSFPLMLLRSGTISLASGSMSYWGQISSCATSHRRSDLLVTVLHFNNRLIYDNIGTYAWVGASLC